jgi:uncharacterized protein (UPF0332 family)
MIKCDPRAAQRVETSLDAAERFLSSSKRNLEIREYEMVAIAANNSSFHSARSLLFARGYVERSHHCLGLAIRGLYSGPVVDLIKTWDKIRLSRHNVQYGGGLVSPEEAEFVINFAEEFLNAARKELGMAN